jgi:hypothetical protein
MLNPSSADEYLFDRAVKWVVSWAWPRGYDAVDVVNLFALRSSDPDVLKGHPSPIGPLNNDLILLVAKFARRHVAAWGAYGALNGRGQQVAMNLRGSFDLYCWGKNQEPAHDWPRYPRAIPLTTELELWRAAKRE